MHRIASVLVVLSLAVVGCSSSKPKASTPEQKYISLLRTNKTAKPIVKRDSDADLISSGRVVCDILAHPDQQNYSTNPLDNLIHSGMDASKAAAIVFAAKQTLCVKPPRT